MEAAAAQWGDALLATLRANPGWTLSFVFLIGFAKSLAVVSLVVPGLATQLAVGGLAAAQGGALWPLVLADGAGAGLGYALSFWVALWFRQTLLGRWPLTRYPELVRRSQLFFARYGAWSVFFGHFFGPVRAFLPIVAGVSGMQNWRFQLANWPSGFLWAGGVLGGAYVPVAYALTGSWSAVARQAAGW